jgi:hypothetical protein
MSVQLERQRDYRKSQRGRVCRSCRRTDFETCWTERTDLCSACYHRSTRNGFCETCGLARYKTSGRGSVAERPCQCPSVDEIRLWDALRWRDPGPITLRELAALTKTCLRTIERKQGVFLEIARRYDSEARLERDPSASGAPMVFVWSANKVVAGLERAVLGTAKASEA